MYVHSLSPVLCTHVHVLMHVWSTCHYFKHCSDETSLFATKALCLVQNKLCQRYLCTQYLVMIIWPLSLLKHHLAWTHTCPPPLLPITPRLPPPQLLPTLSRPGHHTKWWLQGKYWMGVRASQWPYINPPIWQSRIITVGALRHSYVPNSHLSTKAFFISSMMLHVWLCHVHLA